MADPVWRSVSSNTGNEDLTVSVPTACAVGDVLVAGLNCYQGSSDGLPTDNGGGTWVEIGQGADGGDQHTSWYQEVATTAPTGNITFPSTTDESYAVVMCVDGDGDAEVEDSDYDHDATEDTTFDSGTATAAASGTCVVVVGLTGSNVSASSWSDSLQEEADGSYFHAARLNAAGSGAISPTATIGSSTSHGAVVIAKSGTPAATIDESGSRFYDDDADPTTATALAVEDTDITGRDTEETTGLRIQLDATNDPATNAYKLQWRVVGDPDSEWEDLA